MPWSPWVTSWPWARTGRARRAGSGSWRAERTSAATRATASCARAGPSPAGKSAGSASGRTSRWTSSSPTAPGRRALPRAWATAGRWNRPRSAPACPRRCASAVDWTVISAPWSWVSSPARASMGSRPSRPTCPCSKPPWKCSKASARPPTPARRRARCQQPSAAPRRWWMPPASSRGSGTSARSPSYTAWERFASTRETTQVRRPLSARPGRSRSE